MRMRRIEEESLLAVAIFSWGNDVLCDGTILQVIVIFRILDIRDVHDDGHQLVETFEGASLHRVCK